MKQRPGRIVFTRRRGARGMALAVVMMVMFLMIAMVFSVATSGVSCMTLSTNENSMELARYAAEAGANEAYSNLKANSNWTAGISRKSLTTVTAATYDATITNNLSGSSSVTAPDGTTVSANSAYIRANGYYNGHTKSTRVVVTTSTTSVYQFAAYARANMVFSSNAMTDSYDSSVAPYSSLTASQRGDIASAANITLDSNDTIKGNLAATSLTNNGGTITGTVSSVPPVVTLNAVPTAAAAASNNNVTGWTMSGFSYDSTTKAISGRGTLTFNQAGTYYFSSVNVDSNASWNVASNVTGPVIVVVAGDFTTSSNFKINNNTQIPRNFQLMCAGNVSIDSNNTYYGTIYAPNGNVVFSSNTEVFGSVISGGNGTFQVDSNQKIHFDRNLMSVSQNASVTYTLGYWNRM